MLQCGRSCLNLTEVPCMDRRGSPSSFWDWDRVSLSTFVNLSTVVSVSKPKTEDRRPKTEDRRPRTEDRGPRTEDRGPRTEDRFSHLNLQNEDLRQNALLDAKTLNSMGSSFNSFTRLKLKNEDPRWNVLFDAKTLKSMGSSFCSFTRLKLQNEDPL